MIRFAAFELDPERNELLKSGRAVRLRPQACRALALLAARPGELVTRDELRHEIWGSDTFVDFEHGLNLCVREIREALGDSAESPRFVRTIPRRGYCFIAPLVEMTDDAVVSGGVPGVPDAGVPGNGATAATAGVEPRGMLSPTARPPPTAAPPMTN